MKKWTVRLFVLLILGAATTVAVAWGCRGCAELGAWAYVTDDELLTAKHLLTGDAVTDRYSLWALRCDGFGCGLEFSRVDLVGPVSGRCASGWPWLALSVEYAPEGNSLQPRSAVNIRGEHYPAHPLLPGFLIDTLFYAAIWFGLFFGFASARRALRHRRGRGPKCGYESPRRTRQRLLGVRLESEPRRG